MQNQNSISPLFTDTTALILACHPSLKRSQHDQKEDMGQLTHVGMNTKYKSDNHPNTELSRCSYWF